MRQTTKTKRQKTSASPAPRLHPAIVVMGVAFLLIFIISGLHFYAVEVIDPRVTITEREIAGRRGALRQEEQRYLVNEGPVVRGADRLRDLSALALVLGLHRVSEAVAGRTAPPSVGALLDGVVRENLLPPGMGLPAAPGEMPGVVIAPRSTIYVRYRIAPFCVEVLSVPQTPQDGWALLIRLPGDDLLPARRVGNAASNTTETPDAALFVYGQSGEVRAPAPFSPQALIEAQGWERQELRSSALTPEQVGQLTAALQRIR